MYIYITHTHTHTHVYHTWLQYSSGGSVANGLPGSKSSSFPACVCELCCRCCSGGESIQLNSAAAGRWPCGPDTRGLERTREGWRRLHSLTRQHHQLTHPGHGSWAAEDSVPAEKRQESCREEERPSSRPEERSQSGFSAHLSRLQDSDARSEDI